MGTKSRETIYGASIRAAAERATEARKEADRLAVEAWNKRMLGFQGPAQPSPALCDAINAGFGYLEVKCLGCNTHQTVALDIVRRPKTTPVHELEWYMRCRQCSEIRGYLYKRSHLVALRPSKISANDPPSTWWPGGGEHLWYAKSLDRLYLWSDDGGCRKLRNKDNFRLVVCDGPSGCLGPDCCPRCRIRSDEMTRFIYALKEIRACLEAELLTDVQQRLVVLSRNMDNHNGHRVLHQPAFTGR